MITFCSRFCDRGCPGTLRTGSSPKATGGRAAETPPCGAEASRAPPSPQRRWLPVRFTSETTFQAPSATPPPCLTPHTGGGDHPPPVSAAGPVAPASGRSPRRRPPPPAPVARATRRPPASGGRARRDDAIAARLPGRSLPVVAVAATGRNRGAAALCTCALRRSPVGPGLPSARARRVWPRRRGPPPGEKPWAGR